MFDGNKFLVDFAMRAGATIGDTDGRQSHT